MGVFNLRKEESRHPNFLFSPPAYVDIQKKNEWIIISGEHTINLPVGLWHRESFLTWISFENRARGFAGEEAQERLGWAVIPYQEGLGNAVAMGWFSSGQQPKAKSATKSLSEARACPGYPLRAQSIE